MDIAKAALAPSTSIRSGNRYTSITPIVCRRRRSIGRSRLHPSISDVGFRLLFGADLASVVSTQLFGNWRAPDPANDIKMVSSNVQVGTGALACPAERSSALSFFF